MNSRKSIVKIALAATVALSACSPNEVSRTIAFDEEFDGGSFGWGSDRPGVSRGATYIYFKPVDVNGKLEICGVWAHVGEAGRDFARNVISGYEMHLDGHLILKSFTFFTKARSPENFAGTRANCAATGVLYPADTSGLRMTYNGRSSFVGDR